MDLYFNDAKISAMEIAPTTTIGQLKQTIDNWLVPQGVTKYTIALLFSNGAAMAKEVFAIDTYDGANFESQASFLNGGQIQVHSVIAPSPAPVQQQQIQTNTTAAFQPVQGTNQPQPTQQPAQIVEVFIFDVDGEYSVFTDKGAAFEWWVDNELEFSGVTLDEIGLFTPVDYDDELIQETFEEWFDQSDEIDFHTGRLLR